MSQMKWFVKQATVVGVTLLVTRSVRHAALSDRAVFLDDGRVAGATGPPAGLAALVLLDLVW
jgi:hypothetical protein